ncbi:MAG: carbohydrate kinase [Anaerolineae bacterium]|nr:carbohydrate kinase [Anaerolineae bacterium]
MNDTPLLVGLDVGTTNIKALAFTPDGQVMAQASHPTPSYSPQPGYVEYDPDGVWQTIVAALRSVTDQLGPDNARRIASVAAASMGEAAVPLDAHDTPLFPAIAWFDPRTRPQAEWLEKILGRERLFAITGLALMPIYGLCKLLWLKENHPDVFARTVRWLNMADYAAFRLCGVPATDYTLASRTLAFDLAGRRWSDEILAAADVPVSIFAPVVQAGTRLGPVTAEAARLTGLPTSAQVAAGGHDHVCGSLAAGVTAPGRMLMSLGTTATLVMATEQTITEPRAGQEGFTQGAHVIPGLYYLLGPLYTAGGCIEWFKANFAPDLDYAALIHEAQAIPAGSQGVAFLPHLRMASPPFDDPQGRGAFLGLGTEIVRGAMFRAILEGIACDARLILEAMTSYPGARPPDTIFAIGGMTRNALLMQIMTSTLNRAFLATQVSDSTSLGAALLGGVGAGVYLDAPAAQAALRLTSTRVEPTAALVETYDYLHTQVYSGMYRALAPLHHALAPLRAAGA